MTPTEISLLALAGQVINLFLHLRIRNAILESEKRTALDVERRYRLAETCDARMAGMDQRIAALEGRRRPVPQE